MVLRRFVLVLLVLLLVVSGAFAGGGREAAEDDTILIRLGDSIEAGHPHDQSWNFFADRVAELSDGRIEVEVYPQSILGDHTEMLRGLQLGTLEMTKTSNAAFTQFVPETQVFDFPYLFRDKDHFERVLTGPIGERFLREVYPEYGFYGLFFVDAGSRSLYNNVRPVYTPDDMSGLSIRVMESSIMIDTLNAMGASATPLSLAELYDALRQGVMDGAENAPPFFKAQNHYEVAPYLSLTDHFMSPDVLLIGYDFWNSLDADAQSIIKQAAEETREFQWNLWAEQEAEVLDELRDLGVEVNEADTAAFQRAVQPVYDRHGAAFAELVEEIRAVQ